jgi:hypothetical protein
MSHQTETSKTGEMTVPARDRDRPLDLIACGGCGRRFATDDGPGMIAAIKGPCPDCGGRFQLVDH